MCCHRWYSTLLFYVLCGTCLLVFHENSAVAGRDKCIYVHETYPRFIFQGLVSLWFTPDTVALQRHNCFSGLNSILYIIINHTVQRGLGRSFLLAYRRPMGYSYMSLPSSNILYQSRRPFRHTGRQTAKAILSRLEAVPICQPQPKRAAINGHPGGLCLLGASPDNVQGVIQRSSF
jgi:hypothetical protein